ncbi:MAG: DUF3857 domain-containing protein [Planctomycetota bacterium]|nr:DUF3857 domain-containing protein [Planctomycetota bacterium]
MNFRVRKPASSGWLLILFGYFLPTLCHPEETYFDKEFARARRELLDLQEQPRSVVYAYECFNLRSRLSRPEALVELHELILKSEKAHPVLKGHVEWFQASLELDGNQKKAVKARLKRLGFIHDWWVIGPFDNEGKGGFERAEPPEKAIDLVANYKGRERNVQWRQFPPINEYGYQDLDTVFRPNLQVCAYAIAGVQSDIDQPVAIRAGSDDAIKIWLNGNQILSNPAYRPPGFDQDVVGTNLQKGFNHILVKVCQKDGSWGFRLRLTHPDGSQISRIRIISKEHLKEQKFTRSDTAGEVPNVVSAMNAMTAYVENNSEDFRAHQLFGYLLQVKQSHDTSELVHQAAYQKALELRPGDVKTLLLMAETSLDHNKRRSYFEKALQVDPRSSPALYGLSGYYLQRGNSGEQIRLLKKSMEVDPSYYPAELVLAYDYAYMPLRGLAWQMLKPLKERFPEVAWVDYQVGVIAQTLGYKEESAQAYARYLEKNWTSNTVRNYLVRYHLDKQDLRQSLRLYNEMLEVDPGRLDVVRTRALLLANNGKLKQAMSELRASLEICPEDHQTLQLLGDLLKRDDDIDAALSSWKRSLEIHPQNPNLREYLDYYATDDPYELPYLEDAENLAREPLQKALYRDEDNALDLANVVVIKVHPNGATSKFTQNVTRILTERGATTERFPRVYYTASKEMASIESYRVIRKDGRELTSGDISERRVVQGEQNTFYDYRAKTVRLPTLEVGDTIELRYRVSDVASRNYFGEHFGSVELFRGQQPARIKRLVVIAPTSKKLYYHQEGVAPAEITSSADWTTYIWTARNTAGIPNEPMTPPLSAFMPYVHVSSFQNWNEVAKYYANMIRDQFQLDSAVRAAVAELTMDKKNEREKIEALYHYLSQKTRYVGLEFGIHGYLPYPAYQVFSRKYGDCKDKATLLASMLQEAGIQSEVVLVRTRLRGDLYALPASLAAFDHAICYVPGHDLWLDCTTEFNGTTEIPAMDRGALCLRISPEGTKGLQRPPLSKPKENNLNYEMHCKLSPTGELAGDGKLMVLGTHCPAYRDTYKQEARQRIVFEGNFRRYHPSTRLGKAKFFGLDDLESPVKAEFTFSIPRFGRVQQGQLLLATTLLHESLMQQYAALNKRELPLEILYSFSKEMHIEIVLPENAKVLHIPSNLDLKTDYGHFIFEASADEKLLKINQSFELIGQLIQPDAYLAFREFCQTIDEKLQDLIRLKVGE